MSVPREPELEPRRRKELEAELRERAHSWLPDLRPRDAGDDFAAALFGIAARIESEVTERFARVPEKTFLGFLGWVGVTGRSGLAARLPVVFTMTPGSDPVDAPAAVQMQATPAGVEPITLETTAPLRILPTHLVASVAADPSRDALFLAFPGLFSLEAPAAVPTTWRLASGASLGVTELQLEPELGLEAGMVLLEPKSAQRYWVTAVEGGIVTIHPALGDVAVSPGAVVTPPVDLEAGDPVELLEVFEAFGDTERNAQEHTLYVGAGNALDVEIPAVIEVVGAGTFPAEVEWSFWGKTPGAAESTWVGLDRVVVEGRLYLIKAAGSVDELPIGSHKSRWLRAIRAPGAFPRSTTAAGLSLKINCMPSAASAGAASVWPPAVAGAFDNATGGVAAGPAIEGVANTAPLVLSGDFYPLGREPRLFDAFYLGSKEMFSKPAARVSLLFTIGGNFSAPLAGVLLASNGAPEHLVVGVSDDGKLYRLWLSETATTPAAPLVENLVPAQPPDGNGRTLRVLPGTRPGAVMVGEVAHVTIVADGNVWLFTQRTKDGGGNWRNLGAPGRAAAATAPTVFGDTVIVQFGSGFTVYVAMDGRLFRTDGTGVWVAETEAPTEIARLVPVVAEHATPGTLTDDDGLACLTTTGALFTRKTKDPSGWRQISLPSTLPLELDAAFYPVIVKMGSHRRCVAAARPAAKLPLELVAFNLTAPEAFAKTSEPVGHSAAFVADGGVWPFAVVNDVAGVRPMLWNPISEDVRSFGDGGPGSTFVEGPLVLGGWALFPCDRGAVAVAPLMAEVQSTKTANLTDAVVLDTTKDLAAPGDYFVRLFAKATIDVVVSIRDAIRLPDHTWALELSEIRDPISPGADAYVYRALDASRSGTVQKSGNRLKLEAGDEDVEEDDFLYVDDGTAPRVVQVEKITRIKGTARIAEFKPAFLPTSSPVAVTYRRLDLLLHSEAAHVRPSLDTSAASADLKRVLANCVLRFATEAPRLQWGDLVPSDGNRVVLAEAWSTAPAAMTTDYAIVLPIGSLSTYEPPRPKNPELDWEYFDGNGWWKIPGVVDGTANLVSTGAVEFCVPAGLEPTDVVGRTNHWVRARLVSGDYGQATVTVVTKPAPGGVGTIQTVDRDTDSIRPPYVLGLAPSYDVCCPVVPEFVLSKDSASLREQSDSNRTPGATLEFFVPLAQTLAALANPNDGEGDAAAGGPALYLGFDDDLTGGPINLLFLVDDGDDGAFPLRVEALIGNRFQSIVSTDHTRGLGESGLVSLALSAAPEFTALFGMAGYWLRLRPAASFTGAWRPKIHGVYVNAAWAVAAETQSNELVGSSDGSPAQEVTLARTPVLSDSLVLRVREPLGEEERAALLENDPDGVKEELSGRPGPWVLWREVPDTADHDPTERVFSLDSNSGVIRFGDGRQGRVPPMGRDSIVAQRYQRGGGAAANRITAFSQINLSTPLQGVENVVAPEGAAGGSDPDDSGTAVRFAPANLSNRGRALSLRDFETLALQFSPEIAQVRASETESGVRLVVVTRGSNAVPSNAMLRELRAELLGRALPSLALPGGLELLPPQPIDVRIRLRLTITDIEHSGAVSSEVAARLARLLDPANGGQDGLGWLLGATLSDTDVAAALVDTDYLEGIDECVVGMEAEDGIVIALPAAIRVRELLKLVPDGVSVECRIDATEVA